MLDLPHTPGCLACGRDNPHGLHLNLSVDPATGVISLPFTPTAHHIGFHGIAHGGVLATVFDEAMVWAASWHGKRFCVCGELTVRFRKSAAVGEQLNVIAQVTNSRPRLIVTSATMHDATGALIAEASAKYVPMAPHLHSTMAGTLIDDPESSAAIAILRS
jgi:uncharacterized protein (TIGR00369 family)